MKVLLTGGTGFIGSHFLNQALAAGHQVLALRRSPGSCPRIELIAQPEWLDAQLDQISAYQIKGCDVLVHLAAHTGNIPYDTLTNCLRWNLMVVLELFEQARLAGIQRFIVAGSCFEYGHSGERYEAIPADAPLEPSNSYAASKAATSIALSQWAEEYNLNLEILRIFHVFGEGELESRLWPSLRRAALCGADFPMTQGEQLRDFMAVQDVAKAFLHEAESLNNQDTGAIIKNIGSGKQQTIRHFCEYWWNHWQASGKLMVGALPYRPREVMRYIPSVNMVFSS